MTATLDIEEGLTAQEAWLILADDVLWTLAEFLPKLSREAKREITDQLGYIGGRYSSWDELAATTRTTSNNINPEN
ncbi:hypothetical protein G7067_06415 [Leucobacter insecticola]|uniref:Uncharacterized protein n=1 Tax=Leucobacter insecticola TaxID=2714934 RepID=A0A6G8FID9_9MICO|nr:hypothetical protein [Leucobacter insecticola]QIM15673.1 hypothetical protein G7067_03385 [Leucobacter insecticola]QIM16137.1 hypothetical protein G7067_06415 [Leucobacter insecticola]